MKISQIAFPHLESLQLEEIYRDIDESRRFGPTYLLMLFLACLIALLGLLTNSPAVIIGAMLISPLMGPILACGLALTLADWQLGKKALTNIFLSVLEVIGIAALATWLSPLKELTPEILARTNPNLMDLLIAIFSGIAGTVALVKWQKGLTIIPGVAIATAVMPPLAVTGYGVSTQHWASAGGGFMLFFTNMTAIVISADLVFLLAGFRPKQQMAPQQHRFMVRNRILIASALLLLLSIPLVHTLSLAAGQARLKREISGFLKAELEQARKSKIAGLDFNSTEDPIPIEVVIRTINRFDGDVIRRISEQLSAKLNRKIRLDVQQVIVEEAGVGDTARKLDILKGGGEAVREYVRSEMDRMPLVVFEQRILQSVQKATQDAFGMLPGVQLEKERIVLESEGAPVILQCDLTSAKTVSEQSKLILENLILGRLGRPASLELQNRLTGSEFVHTIPFQEKSTTLSGKEKLLLAEFSRRAGALPFFFHFEVSCSSASEPPVCPARIDAVKTQMSRWVKKAEIRERQFTTVSADGQTGDRSPPEVVMLGMVQHL